jgi:hypothetical protein
MSVGGIAGLNDLEFQAATELGLPRLVFLIRDSSAPSSVTDHETGGLVRQHAFRRRLQESGVTTVWIGSPSDLELGVLHALLVLAADTYGPVADGGQPNIIVPTAGGEYEVLRDLERRRFLQWMVSTAVSGSVVSTGHADRNNLELLRRTLHDSINDDAVSEALSSLLTEVDRNYGAGGALLSACPTDSGCSLRRPAVCLCTAGMG